MVFGGCDDVGCVGVLVVGVGGCDHCFWCGDHVWELVAVDCCGGVCAVVCCLCGGDVLLVLGFCVVGCFVGVVVWGGG